MSVVNIHFKFHKYEFLQKKSVRLFIGSSDWYGIYIYIYMVYTFMCGYIYLQFRKTAIKPWKIKFCSAVWHGVTLITFTRQTHNYACYSSNCSSCVFVFTEVHWGTVEMLLKLSDIKPQELHQCQWWGDMALLQVCQEGLRINKVARSVREECWKSTSGHWTAERLNKVKSHC